MDATLDYYDVLGVSNSAETEVLTAAYRALAEKYGPDVYKADDGAERNRLLSEAYAVLSDLDQRATYDEIRRTK